MTYKFNDSTLQEIVDKIMYQKTILSKIDADINNLECFLMSEGIKFGEIDGPCSNYLGTDDQGHFIYYYKNDEDEEETPFGDNEKFGIHLITSMKPWMKFECFELIVSRMKRLLEDMRVNV